MLRRLIILLIPAVALIAWLVIAQLPRWTAPQPGWFAPAQPGVCAAVASLTVYGAWRSDPGGIGVAAARERALEVAADHYDVPVSAAGEPLGVRATLPGAAGDAFYLVTVGLDDGAPPKAAVIYLNAADGTPRALITATEDPAGCAFDVRTALVAALRSPPSILLVIYFVVIAVALVAWRLVKARGVR